MAEAANTLWQASASWPSREESGLPFDIAKKKQASGDDVAMAPPAGAGKEQTREVVNAMSDGARHADELAKCSAFLEPCQASSSSEVYLRKRDTLAAAAASSGESDICGCFFEFVRCFKEICPKAKLPDIAQKAGIPEDECKHKAPDCYYSIWGDPHFVVASAGGQRKALQRGGWSKRGERHFTCGMTAFSNLYSSASMTVSADAEPWFGNPSITALNSVTVTLRPSGKVYTTSKTAYGFDTSSSAPAGFIVTKKSITVLATNERVVVHNRGGHLDAEVWGYCDAPLSTVQKGCDASDDDKNDNVIGRRHHGRRSLSDVAAATVDTRALARAACSAVGDGFVAACELDVQTSGDSAFAEQAAEMTTRLDTAGEFLEAYAAPTAAAVAGATTATVAIAAGVAGGVVGAVALAGGVGAAVYVVKKKRASSSDDAAPSGSADNGASLTQSHGGVNVMNPKPGVHQSITGRAPPVEV
eukprot:m51a1_g6845 hypothetical protein (473) ;mRNA; f:82701-84898